MKAKVWISIDKPTFAEGEPVVGKVNIESHEYIPATEVRVEARVFENFMEPVWVTVGNQRIQEMQRRQNTLFSRDARVSGPTDLGNGSRNFPFSVGIPSYRPTRAGGTIENSVKGVVAVKGRPDVTGQIGIAFAPPGSIPQNPGYSIPGYGPVPTGYGPPAGGPGYGPIGYGAQNQGYQVPQAPTQVITREVVKVRCKYCNTMMDVSASICPNCGAHQ